MRYTSHEVHTPSCTLILGAGRTPGVTFTHCQVGSQLSGCLSSAPRMTKLCPLAFVFRDILRSQGMLCLDQIQVHTADQTQQLWKAWEAWLKVGVEWGLRAQRRDHAVGAGVEGVAGGNAYMKI